MRFKKNEIAADLVMNRTIFLKVKLLMRVHFQGRVKR